jgi:hypothetical protein
LRWIKCTNHIVDRQRHFTSDITKMKATSVLLLSAAAQGADLQFSNVSHITNVVIGFGVATTDGNDMYVPASDGGSVGVIQSHDAGATTEYTVAPLAAILMTASASSDTVVVGGLLGVGISKDFGGNFTQIMPDIAKSVVTQDVKYDAASGLFGLAGNINGAGAVAVSADEGATWTSHPIQTDPPLITSSSIRYGAYPTATTWYATAGFWGDDEAAEEGGRRLSRRVVVGADGKMKAEPLPASAPSSYSGAWGTVVKTIDGGATWTTVFNDTTSGL